MESWAAAMEELERENMRLREGLEWVAGYFDVLRNQGGKWIRMPVDELLTLCAGARATLNAEKPARLPFSGGDGVYDIPVEEDE